MAVVNLVLAFGLGYLLGGKDREEDRPLPLPPVPRFKKLPTVPTSIPAPAPAPYSPGGVIPAAWPTATPAYDAGGPPPFPGPGWEPAHPPTPEIVNRAKQLLGQLALGQHTVENMHGRWIAFLGAMTSGGRGVVAYRVKSGYGRTA